MRLLLLADQPRQWFGRLAFWPVVLTPYRLGGFPLYFSDPQVHEIAMVLRFLVGVVNVRHDETLPCPGGPQAQIRCPGRPWINPNHNR